MIKRPDSVASDSSQTGFSNLAFGFRCSRSKRVLLFCYTFTSVGMTRGLFIRTYVQTCVRTIHMSLQSTKNGQILQLWLSQQNWVRILPESRYILYGHVEGDCILARLSNCSSVTCGPILTLWGRNSTFGTYKVENDPNNPFFKSEYIYKLIDILWDTMKLLYIR